jgi:hypothetical protein
MRRKCLIAAGLGILFIAAGCSSGPQPPEPGTPAFMWSAAKTGYGAGDYLKVNDNLSQLGKGTSEFAARSRPLTVILTSAIAKGYAELADDFDAGAQANRNNPAPFRRQVNLFRSQASAAALQTAQSVHEFLLSNPPDRIPVELPYPSGSASDPVSLQRLKKGMVLPDAEIESLQKEIIQRSVLLAMTRAVGAGDDTAKSLEIFKAGNVTIAKPAFALENAKVLLDLADLYSPKKLDDPQKLNVLTGEIDEALQAAPAGKDTKDAAARLAKIKKGKRA